jgi:hypothetical protein
LGAPVAFADHVDLHEVGRRLEVRRDAGDHDHRLPRSQIPSFSRNFSAAAIITSV